MQAHPRACYAKSEKLWIDDSAGISWETFLTTGESITYGDSAGENTARIEGVYQLSVNGAPPGRVRYSGGNWLDGRFLVE
jgi:hypothetical protein